MVLDERMFAEKDEAMLRAHIADCEKCDYLLSWLNRLSKGPTLIDRVRKASHNLTYADIRRIFRKNSRQRRRNEE